MRRICEAFEHARVLVIGDAMVDRYSFGRVTRLSPEAPVPIFVEERRENRPGGAANVEAQLRALGAYATLAAGPQACVKHRYLVGSHQMFRVDDDCAPIAPDAHRLHHIVQQLHEFNAVILSDYAKGWVSGALAREVIGRSVQQGIPVLVDPKGTDWRKYLGCTVLCPNEAEWAANPVGVGEFDCVLHKRGAEGMRLLRRGEPPLHLPAHARHVFDVTGAGDTVIAVLAAALAAGAAIEDAAHLAALAAAHVVGEVGTSVCSREQLLALVGDSGKVGGA